MRQPGSHILAPVLAVITVSMALPSCDRRTESASWYCWNPDGPCFASPEQCAQSHDVAGEDPGTPCAQRSTAYCSWSCSADACGDNCYSDLAVCEYFTAQERAVYREPCEQRHPPKHPETFPEYSRPDWWCTDLVAETGEDASYCNNSQQECQRYADLVGGTCSRETQPLTCYRYAVDMPPTTMRAYNCARNARHCELIRKQFEGRLSANQMTRVLEIDDCKPWPYHD